MKKETLIQIILGTIGGLTFAMGMCMALIPEWDLFIPGVVVTAIGAILLLCMIPVYKKSHPKKDHKKLPKDVLISVLVGIVGVLVLGIGMSLTMVGEAEGAKLVGGILIGVVGLVICILNYPIHEYLKSNK